MTYEYFISHFFKTVEAFCQRTNYYQLIAVLTCFLCAFFISKIILARLKSVPKSKRHVVFLRLMRNQFIFYFLMFLMAFPALRIFQSTHLGTHLLRIFLGYITTALGVCIFNAFIRNLLFSSFFKISAWSVFVLYITNTLSRFIQILNHFSFRVGSVDLSLLVIFKSAILIFSFAWMAHIVAKKFENHIKQNKQLQPSSQILFSKSIKVVLIGLAVFIGMSMVGIDLSIFAFFAGAFGLGIGFGLQNAFSNVICGISLLLDRAVKPGDVIALDGGATFGVVEGLNARYVSVRTLEGKKHLIPNEEIVSKKVENWSYSDRLVKITVNFRIAFDTDLHLVENLLFQIVDGIERIKKHPEPSVWFKDIIDHTVEVEVGGWIIDPEKGINNVRSAIIVGIWKQFGLHGIRIPPPAREVYLSAKESANQDLKKYGFSLKQEKENGDV